MAGVEILAIEEVATVYGFDWTTFIMVCAIGVAFGCLLIGFGLYSELKWWSFLMGCAIGLFIAFFVGIGICEDAIPLEYENQYKVIVDNSVSMVDFYERYKVIDQDGRIFIVREKSDLNLE